ncbi:hypothetical protein AUJ17_02385 [Candidatus Micrarchaeota archaeon CG1_02_47_40]|nr:MAG: hypothetical protein AUJ17_02385 [Candidatus Micrarchaeota archaeon CG1_02_47_40]
MLEISKGEIWLIDLPEGMGHEQKGKRPGIVAAGVKQTSIAIILPLTGEMDKARFAWTHPIAPSKENGLDKESVCLVFQMRSLDKQRLIHKFGKIEKKDMEAIDAILADMLKLERRS